MLFGNSELKDITATPGTGICFDDLQEWRHHRERVLC